MNDDNQENRPRIGSFRYVVLALAALLVLSLGFALIPADPPAPPPPPFTEQARAAAFDDAIRLRSAGVQLADATSDGGTSAADAAAAVATVNRVVSLLTLHARALLAPGATPTAAPVPAASGTASASASASATPPGVPMSASGLASALAASGAERLTDAEAADGGMARLLAGAGTAQILAARELAAAAGAPDPLATSPVTAEPSEVPEPAVACPATSAAPSEEPEAGPGTGPGAALAAAATSERAAVYAYQAAVTRLPAGQAGPASEFLRSHEELADEAETLVRLACVRPPLQQPGYVLAPDFLAAPATGLAQLEGGTLTGYGDVLATTSGPGRAWALAALQAAAARTVHWGGDPGPFPGLPLDEARLPQLPA